MRTLALTAATLAILLVAPAAHADSFTDDSLFQDAVDLLAGGSQRTQDFESESTGTFASGSTLGDITFTYDLGGILMNVVDTLGTTSGDNSLGTDDGDLFLAGDEFSMGFARSQAIGLYFMIDLADPVFDGDILLTAGGETAIFDADASLGLTSDGADIFFLGIVIDGGSFTSADVTYDDLAIGAFLFNVDDVTVFTSVPEPGTLALLGLGVAGFTARRRRRRS